MKDRILLIDDDQRLADMLVKWMSGRGLDLHHRPDARSGLAALKAPVGGPWDLLILDLMLPDLDGLDLCRRVRATDPRLPIVMLTARGDPTDRVVGLEMGADDYLPKPFDPRELLARIKALLRRARLDQDPARDVALVFGDLEIDNAARQVRKAGRPVELTAYQFELLLALCTQPGRVLSREQLLKAARRDDDEISDPFDRSVDVHISRIRAAIEPDPRHPRYIRTIRGAGYLFSPAAS